MEKIYLIAAVLFISAFAKAQPTITWQKCLGSSSNDEGSKVVATSDGGCMLFGQVAGTGGDVSGGLNTIYPDGTNFWVCKLSSTGTIQWKRMLGSGGDDYSYSIKQTNDGGYILCGTIGGTNTNYPWDTDVSQPSKGGLDCWVVKLSSAGAKEWEKNYGGSGTDQALDIIQTTDGGYAFAAWTGSTNGDITSNPGTVSYWVVKLNSTGTITWQKCYGGSLGDYASSIIQTLDGGYAIAGQTLSTDGDITSPKGGNYDYWVVKTNSTGTIEWQKSLGGTNNDRGKSIIQNADGTYLVLGSSASSNGDKTNYKIAGNTDAWVVKLSNTGSILWNKAYGCASNEARQIFKTLDGGFVVLSDAGANGYDVTGKHGTFGNDYWVAKCNADGDLQWQISLGGTGQEFAQSIAQAADGNYYVCGISNSTDGDVTGLHSSSIITTDAWVVKLAPPVLPITFKDFFVTQKEKTVELNWQTSNEINVSHFNIQRSVNAKVPANQQELKFEMIGKVDAKNFTTNEYSFTDALARNEKQETWFYRIEAIDKDGKKTYSTVKQINIQHPTSNIVLFPNPAKDYIIVQTKEAEQIIITDAFGRTVYQNSSVGKQDNITVNISKLSKGLFTIKLVTKNKVAGVNKFIKE